MSKGTLCLRFLIWLLMPIISATVEQGKTAFIPRAPCVQITNWWSDRVGAEKIAAATLHNHRVGSLTRVATE